ncbi:hypothetical protein B296_00023909 [Ensete ventricosum]|uniref:Uncharacterized protein n=1 Tax=Ensete ventricosum TaxID=4639 RepID=A0A426YTN8_ENSVE|nr:hypothetical protein B296_00023909 [Ensete ventricosum]
MRLSQPAIAGPHSHLGSQVPTSRIERRGMPKRRPNLPCARSLALFGSVVDSTTRTIWLFDLTSQYEGKTTPSGPPPPARSPHWLSKLALCIDNEESLGRTYIFDSEPTKLTHKSRVLVC